MTQRPITSGEINGTATIDDVLDQFGDLRAAVSDLFWGVGVDPAKTREAARVLGLNRGLSWRLSRLVCKPDAASVIADVPGRSSLVRFIEACVERGATRESARAALDALDRFEGAVNACSGDRKTLAMLLANRSDRSDAGELEPARRKYFEGACAVWGVQAQVRFVTVFVFPSKSDPAQLDAAHVTGYVGFRRLSERSWPLSYEAVHDAEGGERRLMKEPLDPDGVGEGELQLITRFCTPARPKIDVHQFGGFKRFELAPGPVGNEGLTTCIFGSYLHGVHPRYSATPDTSGFMVLLHTPVEHLVFDMFVHHDLDVPAPPRTDLLDRLTFPHVGPESEFARQTLPLAEPTVALPRGVSGAMAPRIPGYHDLLRLITARIEMPIDDFDGSRFEMAYPPISTTVSRRFDLHAPPA